MSSDNYIGDDVISERLASLPDIKSTIDELFDKAFAKSPERTYLAVLDIERNFHVEQNSQTKKFLSRSFFRPLVVQQFAQYIVDIKNANSEIPNDSRHQHFYLRLQLIAYSQMWECLGVQRLMNSLLGIANGAEYDPSLLLNVKDAPTTYSVWESMNKTCQQLFPNISLCIEALYYNRIRNAIMHSDYCIVDPWILLSDPLNTAQKDLYNKPSQNAKHQGDIQLVTWRRLFDESFNIFIAISERRYEIKEELQNRSPIKIDLNEFPSPFQLDKDHRGYWVMTRI